MAPAAHESTGAPSSSTSTSTPSSDSESSSLPGMKRGIGIGVVASLTIIIIAVVVYLTLRRRRKLREKAAKEQQKLDSDPLNGHGPALLHHHDDKKPHEYWRQMPVVEADTRSIHELDGAGPVPELPTIVNMQEMEAVNVWPPPPPPPPPAEAPADVPTRQSEGTLLLKDWAKWTAALNRSASSSSAPASASSAADRSLPSPPPPQRKSSKANATPKRSSALRRGTVAQRPQLTLLSTLRNGKDRIGSVGTAGSLSPLVSGGAGGASSATVSPMAVSPLSDVYVPQRPHSAGRVV